MWVGRVVVRALARRLQASRTILPRSSQGLWSIMSASILNKRVIFIDALRGVAALWVVLFHSMAGQHILNAASSYAKLVSLRP